MTRLKPITIRIIESCETPEVRTFPNLNIIKTSYRPLENFRDLRRALHLHTGRLDRPHRTEGMMDIIGDRIVAGEPIVQFEIEIEPTPSVIEPPNGCRFVGAWELRNLMRVSERQVYNAIKTGLVDVFESDWMRKKKPTRHIIVNDRLCWWSISYAHWLPEPDVYFPTFQYRNPDPESSSFTASPWFDRSDVRNAIERNEIIWRYDGKGMHDYHDRGGYEIYAGYHWVQWAASRRPDEMTQLIIQGRS